MIRKAIPIVLVVFLHVVSITAQPVAVNPKSVSREEVEMTQYPPDTTAAAVMLYRKVETGITIDANSSFSREDKVYERWKILKDSGKDIVDYEMFCDVSGERWETVSEISVVTHNINDSGKLTRQKMSRGNIYKEKFSEGIDRITFAPEAVTVGSVVEVSYCRRYPSVDLGPVYIQDEYPVNCVDVDVYYPEYLLYNRSQVGFQRASYKNEIKNKSFAGAVTFIEYHDIYHAEGLPAMKEEPYSYCPEQYLLHLNYNLRSVDLPGQMLKSYSTTWEDVDQAFIKSDLYKCCFDPFKDNVGLIAAISGIEGCQQTIAAVHGFVTKNVRWNGKIRLFPDKGGVVWKNQEGNSADINALVASALNDIDGYLAEPVLVKFRSSGIVDNFTISRDEFDTFILRIKGPDSKYYYYDSGSRYGYVNLLKPNCLVASARLLDIDRKGSWIDLTRIFPEGKSNVSVEMAFNEDGYLSGTLTATGLNADSYDMKSTYHSFDSREEWIAFLEKGTDIHISEASFTPEDGYTPSSSLKFSFTSDISTGPDRIYIEPFVEKFHSEDDFQKEERVIPIEFPHTQKLSYICQIAIPEGYEIEALPSYAVMVCPTMEKSSVILQCNQLEGNKINVVYIFNLNTILVSNNYYQDLRLFWEKVAAIEKSVIVLKKK